MARVFTPRRMAEIEDQIRRYCINCLDPLVGSDSFDIVAELAAMMPMRVIGMLLGIPESEQVGFRDRNDANLRTKPGAPMKVANGRRDRRRPDVRRLRRMALEEPVRRSDDRPAQCRVHRRRGRDTQAPRKEVLHYTQVVAGAGNETTGRLIGWLAKVLAEHPDQRREIERRPIAADPRDRRDAALRADRSARSPLHGKGFRGIRSNGARGQRDASAVRGRQSRSGALRGPRYLQHPPRAART